MRVAPVNDYALFLDLTGRRVLVVGGGTVATRRIATLLAAGAVVDVVAPAASAEVTEWAVDGALRWHARPFTPDDIPGAWLVHAATGLAEVDEAVVAAAERAGTWSVRASDATASPAWCATTTQRDGVAVAVNGGRDPRRAVAVRQGIATALATGDIPLRRRRKPSPDGGRVTLIGAGPGDPDLLTLRGRRLLRQADVVVTDHLVPAAVLADLDPDVEVRYAGKRPGHHSLTQEQINAFIVQRAREGHRVVRLKGGDPFLLGRGGEEALACRNAGIPVDVVPGVTSALSVPASAGIPVTHRGITSSVVVLSGHDGPAGIARQAAAAPADATLVLLMGTRTLPAVADALQTCGRSAQTPAAIIERGWTPQQRTVTGTLGDIADLAQVTGIGSPAIVVVGDVVRLRPILGDLARSSPDAGHALPVHTRGIAAADPVAVP
jgi:uroporphyrin-III C-methyltransferase/precorrin-2 dehydrogenase/sirohydrochlorin ferrochelatase